MSMRSEVRVGLVFILSIILIVTGTIWMQGWRVGQEEHEVRAWFREVGQLQTGSAVKLRGVPIGRVEDITLDTRAAGVMVQMSVSSDAALPEDAVVILAPESMFGDWQAEISSRSRYEFYDYAIPQEQGVLPGYSLPDMSRLTAVADRIAQNLAVITDRVDIAFTDETAKNIRQAIDNIQEVTAQLTDLMQAQEHTVEGVAAGLETTAKTLGEAAETANRAFVEIEGAISQGQLAAIVNNVQTTTAALDTLARQLGATSGNIQNTIVSADSAFASLSSILAQVQQGQGTLGQLLQDTALYNHLVQTNALVQDLLLDFQRNPKKYINLTVF